MYFPQALVLAYLILTVQASLYVIKPSQGSTCHGGQSCTVEWLDDGIAPLLSDLGVNTVGLYTGRQQLVQVITPVDVSGSHSLTFIPNKKAGPNSSTYYIAFSSTTLQLNGSSYLTFSPFFKLDQMSGSFSSPLPSATSTIPIPSTLQHSSGSSSSATPISTETVGTLSTSLSSLTSLSATTPLSTTSSVSSSGFVTSTPSSSTTGATASASQSAGSSQSTSGASSRTSFLSLHALGVLALCFFFFSFF